MFDREELSQTVDKSERGCPDRAGQPLEATVEGRVSQLLLHSKRGGDTFTLALRVGLQLLGLTLHFKTTSQSAHLPLCKARFAAKKVITIIIKIIILIIIIVIINNDKNQAAEIFLS